MLVLRGSQAAAAIRITRQQYVDGKLLRATLLVDEDAPLGVYSVVLVDAGGVSSNALTLEVVL